MHVAIPTFFLDIAQKEYAKWLKTLTQHSLHNTMHAFSNGFYQTCSCHGYMHGYQQFTKTESGRLAEKQIDLVTYRVISSTEDRL